LCRASGPIKRSKGALLDHFVGERHEIRRQLNSGLFCRFQIDDEEIARRLLERDVAWLRAVEDTSNKVPRSLKLLL